MGPVTTPAKQDQVGLKTGRGSGLKMFWRGGAAYQRPTAGGVGFPGAGASGDGAAGDGAAAAEDGSAGDGAACEEAFFGVTCLKN